MKKLPIVRLLVYIFLMVAVTTGLGFAACQLTGNPTAMFVVMFVSTAIGMALIFRWWIPVNRAMGVPATKATPIQWLLGSAILASLAATVVMEQIAYGITRNRVAEAAVSLCILLPVSVTLIPETYRRMRAVTANEFQISRLAYYAQCGLALMFGINLCLWLTERHIDPTVGPLHDWNVAGYIALLTTSPFVIVQMRGRYLQAKALKDSEPPDRWQAHKNTLASNE